MICPACNEYLSPDIFGAYLHSNGSASCVPGVTITTTGGNVTPVFYPSTHTCVNCNNNIHFYAGVWIHIFTGVECCYPGNPSFLARPYLTSLPTYTPNSIVIDPYNNSSARDRALELLREAEVGGEEGYEKALAEITRLMTIELNMSGSSLLLNGNTLPTNSTIADKC